MTLFVSDLHLGRGTPAETAAAERDAVAMLRAHLPELTGDAPGTLVLLGDVYDQFIEYRHLVPKVGIRLAAAVADLADAGVRVVYAVGNRDPWHLGFWRELGAELLGEGALLELEGRAVWVEHGDALDPERRRLARGGRLAPRLHRLLRHPAVARLYRTALPGDAGFGLARFVAQRAGTDGAPDPAVDAALARAARARLDTTPAELVVHGHSHSAACAPGASGTYLNPGYWFGARAYARLDDHGPALLRWPDEASPRPAGAGPSLPVSP